MVVSDGVDSSQDAFGRWIGMASGSAAPSAIVVRSLAVGLVAVVAAGATWVLAGSMRGDVDAEWVVVGEPARESASFEVSVTDPTCPIKLDRDDIEVGVVETNDAVLVRVLVPNSDDGSACKAMAVAYTVTIDLLQPLAQRPIMDGRFDPPRPAIASDTGLLGGPNSSPVAVDD